MFDFEFHNPVHLVFGRGVIPRLRDLVPPDARVLMTYGGGSIRRNGVYDQMCATLNKRIVAEFGGIEPNPLYETLMNAVAIARRHNANFLLAVGGGSVLDGTKFIAAALRYEGEDPWDILANEAPVNDAVPLGAVLTLPATGSEMNAYAVISRRSTGEKLAFGSPHVYPIFSILDPQTTYTLPPRQTVNGIVDAFVHVAEQYMTYPAATALQDRFCEGIWRTLIEYGPRALATPRDYDARATLMWCATMALNGIIGVGAPQDWTTHAIGHELTALYGIDHAQSLAVVLPGVWRFRRREKEAKLAQYAARVWDATGADPAELSRIAIERTVGFFHSIGMKTSRADYGIRPDIFGEIGRRIELREGRIGENGDIGAAEIVRILELCD